MHISRTGGPSVARTVSAPASHATTAAEGRPAPSAEEQPATGTPATDSNQVAALPGAKDAPQVALINETQAPAKSGKSAAPAKPVRASAYGPGLYGNRTANGTRLTPQTVGVAHKTLPLGTRLEVIINGKSVPARVIDRGPYEQGRDFDLTTGLIKKLGFASCAAFGVRKVLIRILK